MKIIQSIFAIVLLPLIAFSQGIGNQCCDAIFLESDPEGFYLDLALNQSSGTALCGIASERDVWFSFISSGEELTVDLTFPSSNQGEVRISVFTDCSSELSCTTSPIQAQVSFNSGNTLIRGKQYYLVIDGLNGSIPEFNIQQVNGIAYPTGTALVSKDISSNPIERLADFRWNKDSDLSWIVNRGIEAEIDEQINLEVLNPSTDNNYILEIEPLPDFIYQRDTAYSFYFPEEQMGRFRIIEQVLSITKVCYLLDSDTICLNGCGSGTSNRDSLPWYPFDIRSGGDNLSFNDISMVACDLFEIENQLSGFNGDFYLTMDDAIMETNTISLWGLPINPAGSSVVFLRNNNDIPVTITTIDIYIDDLNAYGDFIQDQTSSQSTVDFCNYDSFLDPPMYPDANLYGWDLEFFASQADALQGNPLPCPYTLTQNEQEIFYTILSPIGCQFMGSFNLFYDPSGRVLLNLTQARCIDDPVDVEMNIQGVGPYQLEYQLSDGTSGSQIITGSNHKEVFNLLDLSQDVCFEFIQVTDQGQLDLKLPVIYESMSCFNKISVHQLDLQQEVFTTCENEVIEIPFSTDYDREIHLTLKSIDDQIQEITLSPERVMSITANKNATLQLIEARSEEGCLMEIKTPELSVELKHPIKVKNIELTCQNEAFFQATIELDLTNQQWATVNGRTSESNSIELTDLELDLLHEIHVTGEYCPAQILEIQKSALDCQEKDPELDQENTDDIIATRKVYIPNSFSPNNDGNNDDLMVFFQSPEQIEQLVSFDLFSRWGQQILRLENITPSEFITLWDGENFDPQVMVWNLKVAYSDGTLQNYHGDVTLIR